ncbi:MAG: cytochrome P450 [Anaerolineae bacterium]|nr:cytochrome P450 [Anaerolineae bacterium]
MFSFNPLAPEFQANPYAYYAGLRAAAPVFFWEQWGMYFLSRYDDCVTVLRDSRFGHEFDRVFTPEQMVAFPPPPENQRPLIEMERNWMLLRDAPAHTRLRMLVHKAFTPRTVERMRSHIEDIVRDRMDTVQDKGEMDVIADLAFPLPVTVIAELVGIPDSDQMLFRRWSRDLAFTLELTDDPAVYDQGAAATLEFTAYLRQLIAERRKNPQEDLLTALVAAEEAGDKLSEDELIATVILLLLAGHETTVNLIGNGTLALLRNPDQFAKLKADPSLSRNAVEEIIRYDSPVQLTSRLAVEDVEVGGQAVRRGQTVVTLLGAANRDPNQFDDPNTFDITRPGADKHIGFGNGVHFCLGAPLARMEGAIVFSQLAQRFPNLALVTDAPKYRPTLVLRGLEALPVTF